MTPDELSTVQEHITRQILADLRPVSPIPRTGILVAILLLIAAIIVAGGAWHEGTSGIRAQAGAQTGVVFSLLAVSLIAAAMLVANWLVPAGPHYHGLVAVLSCSTLSLLIAVLFLFPYKWEPNSLSLGMICWRIGMTYSSGAALLSFLVLRRAAWLSPVSLGTATGVFAGLAALTVQEIYCPYLDAGHIAVFHMGSFFSAALLGAAFGFTLPRILRSMKGEKQ